MPDLPEKLPEGGKIWWTRLARAFNQLRDYVDSLKPAETPNAEIEHTSLGVARRPKSLAAAEAPAPAPGLRWRGYWSSVEDYVVGDVVRFFPHDPGLGFSDGLPQNGLFVCVIDSPAGSAFPRNYYLFAGGLGNDSGRNWEIMSPYTWLGMLLKLDHSQLGLNSTVDNFPDGSSLVGGGFGAGITMSQEGSPPKLVRIAPNDLDSPPHHQASFREIVYESGGSRWKVVALASAPEYLGEV